jgi:hypothetical protein
MSKPKPAPAAKPEFKPTPVTIEACGAAVDLFDGDSKTAIPIDQIQADVIYFVRRKPGQKTLPIQAILNCMRAAKPKNAFIFDAG